MKRKSVPNIQELLREVEKWAAENSNGKERIRYMRRQVEKLGGEVKKHFIPLKHRLLLKKHSEKKKKERAGKMKEYGLLKKKKRLCKQR